jgi:uncharacterized membrane protein
VSARISGEDIRASLWLWPIVGAVVAFAGTLLLLSIEIPDGGWALWAWPGDVDSATALLQVVASSVISATALIFSLTVVALQLASQQFSPRLLREFARDRFIQFVLTVLVCTFVVALTGLRGMRADGPVPRPVVALSLVLGVVSIGLLLVFLAHVVRSLRIDGLMLAVHRDTEKTIETYYAPDGESREAPGAGLPGPDGGTLLCSPRSGFVQALHPRELVEVARQHDVFLRVGVRPGDHLVAGTPVASAWPSGNATIDRAALADAVDGCVDTGFERTIEQDAAFGLRQLTDIAVKAISPAVNDPVTCAHALGYCADLLVQLQRRYLGAAVYADDGGVPRVAIPGRDHRYYLDLVCSPVRRYGNHEPIVLSALLRILRDCAVGAQDDAQRQEIRRQVGFVLDEARDGLREQDFDAVRDLAHRVELALIGQIDAAYRDRAGETRSI